MTSVSGDYQCGSGTSWRGWMTCWRWCVFIEDLRWRWVVGSSVVAGRNCHGDCNKVSAWCVKLFAAVAFCEHVGLWKETYV